MCRSSAILGLALSPSDHNLVVPHSMPEEDITVLEASTSQLDPSGSDSVTPAAKPGEAAPRNG
jgi:hypothetical protein